MPNKSKKTSPRYKTGDSIILDQAEYEVWAYGDIHWDGVVHEDSYALWDKDGYGRIEKRSYVDNRAEAAE